MIIKQISFKQYISEMRGMFKEHWEEVASNKNTRYLNIDENMFISLEDTERLLTLGAFDNNVLIGYSVNILVKDTHDYTKLLCVNDALYVDKKYRKGSIGVKLIKQTENLAQEYNVYGVVWHAKPNSNLDKLLEKLNYNIKDFLYLKEI